MDYLLTAIFGKRATQQLSSGDYVDWAGEMLVQGYDSRSLRILAGLDRFASPFEAEDYFLRSITELGLTPPDSDTAIRAYACEIARQIIEDKITGQEGVRALYKICLATDYASDFMIWLELDDALDSLLYGDYPFTYESATLDTFDEIAKREAANFIAAVCPQAANERDYSLPTPMRTDKDKLGLRGPVKNVLIETARFEEPDGQMAEKPWFSYTNTFNRDGQVIEQVNRNPDGSEWRTVNHYSGSGNLLSTKSFDPTGALNSEVKYIYDANDRLAAEQHVTRDGTVTTPTTYAYNDAGKKVKIQELDFSEKIQEFDFPVKIQELDSPGETKVMIGIEGTSTMVSADGARRVESSYDDRGEVVEVKAFNIDGALVSRVEITRDARGNALEEMQYVGDVFPLGPCASDSCSTEEMAALTEEQKAEFAAEVARLFSPGTAMSKHTHRYDSEGRLIESKFTMMGMEVSHQLFAYDEVGNRSEEVSYSADGTSGGKTIFAREYDEHGNWTRELVSTASNWESEFGLSTPVHVTRRQITYW